MDGQGNRPCDVHPNGFKFVGSQKVDIYREVTVLTPLKMTYEVPENVPYNMVDYSKPLVLYLSQIRVKLVKYGDKWIEQEEQMITAARFEGKEDPRPKLLFK